MLQEVQVNWSQNYATEILYCYVLYAVGTRGVGNAIMTHGHAILLDTGTTHIFYARKKTKVDKLKQKTNKEKKGTNQKRKIKRKCLASPQGMWQTLEKKRAKENTTTYEPSKGHSYRRPSPPPQCFNLFIAQFFNLPCFPDLFFQTCEI